MPVKRLSHPHFGCIHPIIAGVLEFLSYTCRSSFAPNAMQTRCKRDANAINDRVSIAFASRLHPVWSGRRPVDLRMAAVHFAIAPSRQRRYAALANI